MRNLFFLIGVLFVGCYTGEDIPSENIPTDTRERHERFIGIWAVSQPSHALYEVTYYEFKENGTLIAVVSEPADCTDHLSRHCVTGSVANCALEGTGHRCESDLTCVFGDEWYSIDFSTLVIIGNCSDGRSREIFLSFNEDSFSNTAGEGGGAVLVSVDGDTDWSHDNWPWNFRKCPAGTNESNCFPAD